MEPIADRKLHFAPYARQLESIESMLAAGEVRNVTDLMRRALDHYMASRGRPSLVDQARMMAADFHDAAGPGASAAEASAELQRESMVTDEDW